MSFTIRTVTSRVGGGDIVRTRRVDASTARIGRGTDCEIHIPDLAVQLNHASVSVAESDVISVRGAHFEWNGRNVSEASFRAGDSATLLIGSRKLEFTAGDVPDEVIITISQTAGVGERADQSRLRQVFSPSFFSIRAAAWMLGLAVVLASIAAPIGIFYFGWGEAKIHPDRQWSPGPLSLGHHFLSRNCQACHQQAFVSVRDDACLSCHKPGNAMDRAHAEIASRVRALGSPFAPFGAPDHASLARQLRSRMEFQNPLQRISATFAELFNHPALRCAACHTEHVGAAGERVLSGMAARVSRGQLKNFDCISCHRHIRENLPDSIVADAPSWSGHPEFRPLLLASTGQKLRGTLADVSNEKTGVKFSHWQHLNDPAVIDEAVKSVRYGARLTCKNCHELAADGRSFVAIEMTKDCSACHDLKYAIGANQKKLALTHGEPDTVVSELRTALTAQRWTSASATRRRPGYVGDPYRDPMYGERVLSPAEVVAMIRGTFQKGGLCYGCHTFQQPEGTRLFAYRVLPVLKQTYRTMGASQYFPWSAFDHGIPEHRQDALGNPTCETCHKISGSNAASYAALPPVSECRTCHGATRASTKTPASSDCMDCHGYHVSDRPLSASFDNLRRSRLAKGPQNSLRM